MVSRLAIGNWPDLEIIWISMNHAFCNVQECDYHDTIGNVFLWTGSCILADDRIEVRV